MMSRVAHELPWLTVLGAFALAACSSAQTRPPDSALRAAGVPRGAHELTCEYASMDSVQGWHDDDVDWAGVFAVFHLPEARTLPPKQRISWKTQVSRSRVSEHRDELATLAEPICTPEAGSAHPH
jgi:hypothetical protein